jgi:hypothetical protein
MNKQHAANAPAAHLHTSQQRLLDSSKHTVADFLVLKHPCLTQVAVCDGLTGCRVLSTDDFEAGTVNVTVPPASAQPYSVGSARISSAGDSAEVALTDRVALLDLTFSAAPLALSNQGELQSAVSLRGSHWFDVCEEAGLLPHVMHNHTGSGATAV